MRANGCRSNHDDVGFDKIHADDRIVRVGKASQRCPDTSTPRPCGLALLHERVDPGAEVLAAVTRPDEIIAVRQPRMENAADRLLAYPHRQRRMVREA